MQVKVDLSAIKKAMQKFRHDQHEMERLMNEMARLAAGENSQFWRSQASDRYRDQFCRLDDEICSLKDTIQKHVHGLCEHAEDICGMIDRYENTEELNNEVDTSAF